MIRIGGPVFTSSRDPGEIVAAHAEAGYRAAYAPGWLSLDDTSAIRAFREACGAADLIIAEVGAWGHIIHPDAEVAGRNRARVVERLALADELGARCCVDYTGSRGEGWYHPDNLGEEAFDEIVAVAREIIDAVRPTRTVLALEMMPSVHPENPDDYLRLLASVDRPGRIGVHLDPVNIITSPRRYFDTTAVLRDCFARLGPHIASCHAKDVTIRSGFIVHLDECRPGTGNLDYVTYLRELDRLPQQPPLMLEHLPDADEYRIARHHLVSLARSINLEV